MVFHRKTGCRIGSFTRDRRRLPAIAALLCAGCSLLLFNQQADARRGRRILDKRSVPPPAEPLEPLVSSAGIEPVPAETIEGKQPLTLNDAICLALAHNPSIQQAQQEIERTEGRIIEVRSQALPQIVLTGNYQQQDKSLLQGGGGGLLSNITSPFSQTSPTPKPSPSPSASPSPAPQSGPQGNIPNSGGGINNNSWQITLQATQVIYSGGAIRASIRMAKLTDTQAIFKLRDIVDQTIATVQQQFALVVLNRALIRVQEEAVALLERQLSDQRARFETGTVPQFNVLQAEVALSNAIPALIQARNNERLSQIQLAKTLNYKTSRVRPEYPPFEIIGNLDMPLISVNLAEALQQARERRASLKAQRLDILISAQNIVVQQAGYKPTLQANAGYTVLNNRFSSALDDIVTGWFFGVQGSWTLFDGFATHGRVQQARAQLEEAHSRYVDAVAQVELEVQEAWANLTQALETVQSQEKSIEQAREAVRMATERLATGAGTQLDLLNATVALTQAETTTLQARYQYIAALAEFQRATASATRYNESFEDPLIKRKAEFVRPVKGR